MNKNIYSSLLRDVRAIRVEQEKALKKTILIEERLIDLVDERPKYWTFCGLKIMKNSERHRTCLSTFSIDNNQQNDQIYYSPPENYVTIHQTTSM